MARRSGFRNVRIGDKLNRLSSANFTKKTEISESESTIQCQLIKQLGNFSYQGYPLNYIIHAIPNGGYRSKKTAAILKAEGVVSGVPDLHCVVPRPPYVGLYIEMKKPKTGVVSEEQIAYIAMLRKFGHKVIISRGVDHALTEIFKYLGMLDNV